MSPMNRADYPNAEPMAVLRRNVLSGFLAGIGAVAFVDETVFHQLLHWHHFYDRSTPAAGLVADGLFHAFSWFASIAGLLMFAEWRRRGQWLRGAWWGGLLCGAGAFQLYDGTIQHKLMRIHQIRYVDNVGVYDWGWNLSAAAILLGGLWLWSESRRKIGESHANG